MALRGGYVTVLTWHPAARALRTRARARGRSPLLRVLGTPLPLLCDTCTEWSPCRGTVQSALTHTSPARVTHPYAASRAGRIRAGHNPHAAPPTILSRWLRVPCPVPRLHIIRVHACTEKVMVGNWYSLYKVLIHRGISLHRLNSDEFRLSLHQLLTTAGRRKRRCRTESTARF